MTQKAKQATSPRPIRAERLAYGYVLCHHEASIQLEAWNTTSHVVKLAIADATGQHGSAVFLSHETARNLEKQLGACREARMQFDADYYGWPLVEK